MNFRLFFIVWRIIFFNNDTYIYDNFLNNTLDKQHAGTYFHPHSATSLHYCQTWENSLTHLIIFSLFLILHKSIRVHLNVHWGLDRETSNPEYDALPSEPFSSWEKTRQSCLYNEA